MKKCRGRPTHLSVLWTYLKLFPWACVWMYYETYKNNKGSGPLIFTRIGTFLAVQWLRLHTSNAGDAGSILHRGTEIPHTTWCGQNIWGFLGGASDKEPACQCDVRDTGSIPKLGRSPGEGNGNPFQYSCPENYIDRGAWWATVHKIAKSQTWLTWLNMHARIYVFTRTC